MASPSPWQHGPVTVFPARRYRGSVTVTVAARPGDSAGGGEAAAVPWPQRLVTSDSTVTERARQPGIHSVGN